MDHDGSLASWMLLHDSPVEGQDGCGIVGHSMVRPGCEVELSHTQRVLRAVSQLEGEKREQTHSQAMLNSVWE